MTADSGVAIGSAGGYAGSVEVMGNTNPVLVSPFAPARESMPDMESATDRIRRRLAARIAKGKWAAFGRALGYRNPSTSIAQYFSGGKNLNSEHLDAAAAYVGLTVEELVGVSEPGERSKEARGTTAPGHGTTSAPLVNLEGGLYVPHTEREWMLLSVRLVQDPNHIAQLNRLIGEMIGRESRRRESGPREGD